MAAIECGKGHLYDPEIYATCPYCNNSQTSIQFNVAGDGRTAPMGAPVQPGAGYIPSPPRTVADVSATAPVNRPVGGPAWAPSGQSVANDGHTLPPKGYSPSGKSVDADIKTQGVMQHKLGLDPVVGWLVCIDGKEKGTDYKLRGQINTIGRSEKMDVCIKGDKTISSENHARLSYSEKTNRFKIIPAESRNIIYLNGEEVFTAETLNPYDVIDLGETKVLFVPLCCDKFTWQTGAAENQEEREDGDGSV